MKASRYNIATNDPSASEAILFNTLYGGTVALDSHTLPVVKRLLDAPGSASTGEESRVLATLAEGKFIVEEDADELEIVVNRKLCGVRDKNRADVIIMPNMDCNFACPYCYESHDSSKRMSKEVEDSVKVWLGGIIDSHKVVLLNWFGGEPLLGYETILSIGGYALERCRDGGVSLLTNITTNGYVFTRLIIEELIAIEVFSYQVTMDGPPDIHNKTRLLKSGGGSFDRVMANVLLLAGADERVKISLRVNYNHKNMHAIPELLEVFPPEVRPQLRVVYEPIFGSADLSATQNIPSDEISSVITGYYDLAREMGFDVVLGGLGVGRLVYCYAEREHEYIVNFNGDVFKCSVTDFPASERVGYISSSGDFIQNQKWDAWFDMALFEEKCEECVFLPLCMGGCRKDRVQNKGTGSYCSLVPTNTSHALKSIAFGTYEELLEQRAGATRDCAECVGSLE